MIEWLASWTPSLILTAAGAAVAVWAARRHAGIQTEQLGEQARVQAQTQPLDALVRVMERQDARLETILARDTDERRAIARALDSIAEGVKTLSQDITAQREDAQRRAGKLYEHLETLGEQFAGVRERLAALEGNVRRPT